MKLGSVQIKNPNLLIGISGFIKMIISQAEQEACQN